jgi:hypothetical protein
MSTSGIYTYDVVTTRSVEKAKVFNSPASSTLRSAAAPEGCGWDEYRWHVTTGSYLPNVQLSSIRKVDRQI